MTEVTLAFAVIKKTTESPTNSATKYCNAEMKYKNMINLKYLN